MLAVEVLNLKKTFNIERPVYKQILSPFGNSKKLTAIDSASFNICSGEILGVVGPNGAGKTTLLRMLADILLPDSGSIRLCGNTVTRHGYELRRHVGYVSSDERSFFWRLTGKENLEFFASLYGLNPRQATARTASLLEQFDFIGKANRLFRDYSAGMRKKVSVMRAFIHNPSLLLLDEVTNSLDPNSAKMVMEMVRQYVSEHENSAAIWSTHRLEEISLICDRVMMIESGKIVTEGLARNYGQNSEYLLKLQNLNGGLNAFCEKIGGCAKVTSVEDEIMEILISGIDQKQFSQVVSMAVKDYGAYVVFAGCVKRSTV